MRKTLANLIAVMLCLYAEVALAQANNGQPVKVTVAEPVAQIDPERFGPAPSTSLCKELMPTEAKQGEALIRKIAQEEQFDPDLLVAIARQESGFRMESISSAGAVGLMQLMPATAKRFNVDICDPEDNVRGGIRYLRLLQKKYQNPIYVLAAYNAGEGAVEQNGGIPLYPETVSYVSTVLTNLYGWQPLAKSSAKGSAARRNNQNQKPDNSPEAWSQGFVLHVE